jgi:hypothetical protein
VQREWAATRGPHAPRLGAKSDGYTGDNMKLNTKVVCGIIMLLPLWACEREGPLERAGEEIDEAVDDVRRELDR